MAFPQSSHAFADERASDPWFFCDRCGFRYPRSHAVWQFDFRGLQLQNLRILVCTDTCNDDPQPQLRPIIIGPDPVPIVDARPGFQATQQGYTPAVDILELVDGDILPPANAGLGNNNGVLYLTSPSGWPTIDTFVSPGMVWSNGGECTIAEGSFTALSAVKIVFGTMAATQLLQIGARGLPLIQPLTGSGILWNPWGTSGAGGPIFIA